MFPTTCSRLYSRDSAWAGVFVRSARSSVLPVSAIVLYGISSASCPFQFETIFFY